MTIDYEALARKIGWPEALYWHAKSIWWVKGKRLPEGSSPRETDWVRARDSTVEALWRDHMTAALDDVAAQVSIARDGYRATITPYTDESLAHEIISRAGGNSRPTRFDALYAACMCLPDRGEA